MEGLGIDIVDVGPFEKHAKNLESAFCKKVFTDGEREYLKNKNTPSMAGLYAAKEAVAKALGTGFRGFFPKDIEIRHNELGAPYVVLHRSAKKPAQDKQILISISHTKTTAVAMAQIGT